MATIESEPDEIPAFIDKWFGVSNDRADALKKELSASSHSRQLLRTPLFAAIVCWLWECEERLERALHAVQLTRRLDRFPTRSSELVGLCIRALLLEGRPDDRHWRSIDPVDVDETLVALARDVAEHFNGTQYVVARHNCDIERWNAYRKQYAHEYGLFYRASDGQLEIVHQSIAEWLVAFHIVQLVRKLAEQQFQQWLEEHVGVRILDRRWQTVWQFVAGLLPDDRALRILDWLAHTCMQDDFVNCGTGRYFVTYAFEIAMYSLPFSITREISADHWWVNVLKRAESDQSMRYATRMLAQLPPDASTAFELTSLLRDHPTELTAQCAFAAIAVHGPFAADAICVLVSFFERECSEDTLRQASYALVRLRDHALSAVPRLLGVLKSPCSLSVLRWSTYTLCELSPDASSVADDLVGILNGAYSEDIKRQAIVIIEHLQLATKPIVDILNAVLVGNEGEATKYCAAAALAKTGGVSSAAVHHLLEILMGDFSEEAKCCAADALGSLGAAATTYVPTILALMRDGNDDSTRVAAGHALGQLGSAASIAVDGIAALVYGTDDGFTTQLAISVLEQLGDIAASAVPHLVSVLRDDPYFQIKGKVADALGRLGRHAATIVTALFDLIDGTHDEDTTVCALIAMRELATIDQVSVLRLKALLHGQEGEDIRAMAADALVASDSVSDTDVECLRELVRSATIEGNRVVAADALGMIGPAALPALDEVLDLLDQCSNDWYRALVILALRDMRANSRRTFASLMSILDGDHGERVKIRAASALSGFYAEAESAIPILLRHLHKEYSRKAIRYFATYVGELFEATGLSRSFLVVAVDATQRCAVTFHSASLLASLAETCQVVPIGRHDIAVERRDK